MSGLDYCDTCLRPKTKGQPCVCLSMPKCTHPVQRLYVDLKQRVCKVCGEVVQ